MVRGIIGPARAKDIIDAGRFVRLHFPALSATGDRRAGMRSFIENGPGKATFTGR